jgi:hypothetical protein
MAIGLSVDALPATGFPDRVVLVVDEGAYWFDLRAAVWRGTVTERTVGPVSAGDDSLVWFHFEPLHFAGWDYGRLHEEPRP